MSKQTEALKLALEALEYISSHYMSLPKIGCMALAAIEEALAEQPAQQQEPDKDGSPCPEFWDWLPKTYNFVGSGNFTKYNMEVAFLAGKQSVPAQQKTEFVSPGGGYVPAIPRPLPIDWKLVPRKATPEMLKAMDECAQEGYDERLYEGMASSVYMAAWDASPTMGILPEQPAQQQEPVAWQWLTTAHFRKRLPKDAEKGAWNPLYTSPPPRKPLTDEEIKRMAAKWFLSMYWPLCNTFAREIEAAHGIKGEA